MNVGKEYCTVCGKKKEHVYIKYANINAYIECECEKKLREEKESADIKYALNVAHWLRNRSSHLSSLGASAFFDKMKVDKYNDMAIRAGKFTLSKLLSDEERNNICSIVFQGNRGSGKTFISSAVINEFNVQSPVSEAHIDNIIRERSNGLRKEDFSAVHSPCKFITEMDLYALYYENFNYCKVDSPVDEYKKCKKLLVIDDIGSSNYDRGRIQAMYHNIFDYRHSEKLPVIVTTNLNKRELCDYIGDRAFDRLRSYSYFIDLTSPESRR